MKKKPQEKAFKDKGKLERQRTFGRVRRGLGLKEDRALEELKKGQDLKDFFQKFMMA